jgi:hypothetical protein
MNIGSINDDKLIIVDLILRRMPYGEAVTISGGFWSSLLHDKYQELGDGNYYKAVQVLQDRNYREIKSFLLEQGYIETENHLIPSYKLIDKGKDARDKGGHAAYVKWQNEEAALFEAQVERDRKEQRKINWPQKYWWVVLLIGCVVSVVATILITDAINLGKDYIESKRPILKTSQQPQLNRPLEKDTSHIYKSGTLPAKNKK